jgi:uncharacterized RDD family membrane protein YckC
VASGYRNGLLLRRWMGHWVDLIVLGGILLVPDATLGNERYQATLPLWLGLAVLYFPITEGLTGRSLGKLLTSTTVTTVHGGPPGLVRAIKRTITRLFEVNPIILGGIPAGIAVLASARHQRLGDMWAGTYVVLARDLREIMQLHEPDAALPGVHA